MFQQVPLVEIDGMKLIQTKAILQYIAEKYNLYGKDIKERAMYVPILLCDGIRFLWLIINKYIYILGSTCTLRVCRIWWSSSWRCPSSQTPNQNLTTFKLKQKSATCLCLKRYEPICCPFFFLVLIENLNSCVSKPNLLRRWRDPFTWWEVSSALQTCCCLKPPWCWRRNFLQSSPTFPASR